MVKWWVAFAISAIVAALGTALALPYWADLQDQYRITGPTLWDSTSMMAGLALGTLLRFGLGRTASSRAQGALMVALLVILGLLTFLPWSSDSVVRVILLPLGVFVTAAWGLSGSRGTVKRQTR